MKKSKEEIEKLAEEKYGKNSAHPIFKGFFEGYTACQESQIIGTRTKIKNAPDKIYLQIGEDCPDDADFKELNGVSWAAQKINHNDIEYVRQESKELQGYIEILQDSLTSVQNELNEANDYLNAHKIPTNGFDAQGNLGIGKRENLTLKQRLTFLFANKKSTEVKSEIDVYELAERIMGSESIEASVWLIKEYAFQNGKFTKEDMKNAYIEGHSIYRCVTDNHDEALESFTDYLKSLNSKSKP